MKNLWKLELPYAPSINKRLKFAHGKSRFTKAGKQHTDSRSLFKRDVWVLFRQSKLPSWKGLMLKVTVEIFCPDKRHRDADGIIKECFDALQDAGCFDDDYQIKKYTVERLDEIVPNGKVIITIEEYEKI